MDTDKNIHENLRFICGMVVRSGATWPETLEIARPNFPRGRAPLLIQSSGLTNPKKIKSHQ
jgi:hypothetical protein